MMVEMARTVRISCRVIGSCHHSSYKLLIQLQMPLRIFCSVKWVTDGTIIWLIIKGVIGRHTYNLHFYIYNTKNYTSYSILTYSIVLVQMRSLFSISSDFWVLFIEGVQGIQQSQHVWLLEYHRLDTISNKIKNCVCHDWCGCTHCTLTSSLDSLLSPQINNNCLASVHLTKNESESHPWC